MKANLQTKLFLSLFIIGSLAKPLPANGKLAVLFKPELTLEIAQHMAQACQARQIRDKKTPVSIAIYDRGARLILFYRMTGATLGASSIAMEKGKSSAHFPVAAMRGFTCVAASFMAALAASRSVGESASLKGEVSDGQSQ